MRDRIEQLRPTGFTLVEVLMVIGIITLMTTLLVGATWRLVVGARESATATTIMKADGIIQDRVRAFREFDFSDAATATMNVWNVANSSSTPAPNRTSWLVTTSASTFTLGLASCDQISQGLADVLVRKTLYKKAFPQAFAELDASQIARFFPTPPPPAPPATAPPPPYPPSNPSYNPKFESGIVLYAVLMKGETFGAPTPGNDTFTGAEIKTSPETGDLPCLVDAWGEPLRFYRWPTRLIRCGEQNFSGSTSPPGYDNLNQNGQQDPPGWVDSSGNPSTFSPAIRPCAAFPAPTPASLLMSNLPPFNYSLPLSPGSYVYGLDGAAGNANYASAPAPFNVPPFNMLGSPDTDDPEPLNVDPDDPSLKLAAWLFDPALNGDSHQSIRRSNFVSDFHDFYTFQTPLIVSAGSDRSLGLYEPYDFTTTCGYLAAPNFPPGATGSALVQSLFDNITNLNQRAGGK